MEQSIEQWDFRISVADEARDVGAGPRGDSIDIDTLVPDGCDEVESQLELAKQEERSIIVKKKRDEELRREMEKKEKTTEIETH